MERIRSIKRKIQECNDTLENMNEIKKQKIALEKKLKELKMNLINEKKIKWVNMNFEHWLEDTEYKTFYIWTLLNHSEYGVWEGEDELNDKEFKHFKDFLRDYFYYDGPDFMEHNEMTEMEHAFEDGDAKLSQIYRDDL